MRPGAAQGFVLAAHRSRHWSNFLAFGLFKLVTCLFVGLILNHIRLQIPQVGHWSEAFELVANASSVRLVGQPRLGRPHLQCDLDEVGHFDGDNVAMLLIFMTMKPHP